MPRGRCVRIGLFHCPSGCWNVAANGVDGLTGDSG
ncbi:MAG TPA: hypothetical protein DEF41_14795 [Desulfovibrio sp.]|uniref:Uncharacterized protein n=1 Tax=Nitratidesulfovibrio vulgaris (strain ATCC 29579 / DSM 644 / CCUG 34227 / NCIMB 8303 / VKM B-1760 / Hildenborough) TaxID=882 RepID=Q72AD7_NITV2|nr:hypothetical protein DVU_2060 [Nitratidesulfovibrio vulgaris str. Hildenborough]HBW17345.1 hypothetical protein [Desulfovibrio sp.]